MLTSHGSNPFIFTWINVLLQILALIIKMSVRKVLKIIQTRLCQWKTKIFTMTILICWVYWKENTNCSTYQEDIFSFEWNMEYIFTKHDKMPHIFMSRNSEWKYLAFNHVSWKYIPHFIKNEKITFLSNFIMKEKYVVNAWFLYTESWKTGDPWAILSLYQCYW
jgi:hypothetical protein